MVMVDPVAGGGHGGWLRLVDGALLALNLGLDVKDRWLAGLQQDADG
jgi:hypothetical protein